MAELIHVCQPAHQLNGRSLVYELHNLCLGFKSQPRPALTGLTSLATTV